MQTFPQKRQKGARYDMGPSNIAGESRIKIIPVIL
jgi:hypothetical protein